jgi:transcriptional regulator with XRE-family HTH domain
MAEEKPLGDVIRDARVSAGMSLRDFAKALNKTPSYLSDIENNRRVPAEPVLRDIVGVLPLDYDDLMARAGRFGEHAVRYMMRTPGAGVLMRKLSDANASSEFLEKLTKLTDEAANEEKKESGQ